MPLEFQVNIPKQNTIKYEVVEGGVWAYIKEIPTTRVFAETEDDACVKLMVLIMGISDKNEAGSSDGK
jgi:hypothetical protein